MEFTRLPDKKFNKHGKRNLHDHSLKDFDLNELKQSTSLKNSNKNYKIHKVNFDLKN